MPRSWEAWICCMPRSILTKVSLVISTPKSCNFKASLVCPMPFAKRNARIANAPQKHQSTHPKNYQMFQDAILTNF